MESIKTIFKHISSVNIGPGDLDLPSEPPTSGSVQSLIQIFFGVVAAVAVLIITIAAMYFALSRGNPEKAARARSAIIYAAVGLIIALLAVGVVEIVIGRAA